MKTPKHTPVTPQFNRKPLAYLIGSIAMASCLAGTQANAQEATSPAATDEVIQVIDIIGTRQAEQNAIDRKKKAKTAMDSIVAEDVGALPDSNIGEAISRIAGIGLDRGDSGEGVGISVRGVGADLTRIEVDGMGMQSGGGASSGMNGTLSDVTRNTAGDFTGGASGRSQGVKDMPADLIKSVDVIKGVTADMNEGSLGGAVQIKTRSALDFSKRYSSIRLSASQNSINEIVSPNASLTFADKFFDDRVGVLISASKSHLENEGHQIQNSDNNRGYNHFFDLDNSPEKTSPLNPNSVLQSDVGLTPVLKSPLTAGGTLDFESPYSLVQKAASAQTKAQCLSLFPALSTTQVNAINGTTARNAARLQRSNELQTCLIQWNDWAPQNIRNVVKRDEEDRYNIDLRLDFKVTDDLVMYTKYSTSSRDINNKFSTYSQSGAISEASGTGISTDVNGVRTAVANSGYYTNPNNIVTSNSSWFIQNNVFNLIPGSAVVDANHHVTSYRISNAAIGVDQQDSAQNTDIHYFQLGGTYDKDRLLVEFMASESGSRFTRLDQRASIGYNAGEAEVSVDKDGLWHSNPVSLKSNSAASSFINYAAATAATQPQYFTIGGPPRAASTRLNETGEINAKTDVTFKLDELVPFFTQIKTGLNFRRADTDGWGGGGATIQSGVAGQANITLPGNEGRGFIRSCIDTAGSLGTGGVPCSYGVVNMLPANRDMNITLTDAQMQSYLQESLKAPNATFFNGMNGRTSEYIDGWSEFDVRKFMQLAGFTNALSLDCIKECVGTDGNVYKQPYNSAHETTYNAYIMTDFEIKDVLPFGMELDGNMGLRYVKNEADASGLLIYTRRDLTSTFDPTNPNAAAGFTTQVTNRQVTTKGDNEDVLPSFNAALWTIPDELVLRYSWGKTVAKPSIWQLLPNGNCTYSEITEFQNEIDNDDSNDVFMGCSGRFGNPNLKPWKNTNTNLSIEWYPNKGNMVSATVFKQKGEVGGPRAIDGLSGKVFANSGMVDPVTGVSVEDVDWTYRSWENSPGSDIDGLELSAKSSFTFLPSILKYTGIDVNYSKVKNKALAVTYTDLTSGEELGQIGQVNNSYNVALWYDDGHLNVRVAYQHRSDILRGYSNFTPSGQNGNRVYPNAYLIGGGTLPYYVGNPVYEDASDFLDAKITYRFTKGFDVYLEGRNLTKQPTVNSSGGYSDFANGAPNIYSYNYFGRKITAGLNYKF